MTVRVLISTAWHVSGSYLVITGNNLTGSIPDSFGNLSAIVYVVFRGSACRQHAAPQLDSMILWLAFAFAQKPALAQQRLDGVGAAQYW